jgi:hypothetical protein
MDTGVTYGGYYAWQVCAPVRGWAGKWNGLRLSSLNGASLEAGEKKTACLSPAFLREAITPRWGNHLHGPGLQASPAALPDAPARDCHWGRWGSTCTNADDNTRSTSGSNQDCPLCFAVCEKWKLRLLWRDGNITRGCNRLLRVPVPPKLHGTPAKCICSAWLPPRSPSPECSEENSNLFYLPRIIRSRNRLGFEP